MASINYKGATYQMPNYYTNYNYNKNFNWQLESWFTDRAERICTIISSSGDSSPFTISSLKPILRNRVAELLSEEKFDVANNIADVMVDLEEGNFFPAYYYSKKGLLPLKSAIFDGDTFIRCPHCGCYMPIDYEDVCPECGA